MFLSPEIILEGYNKGLFPMADSFNDPFIYWVDPKERGIIKLNEFKISRSLKKELKKNNFNIKVNKNFEKTINLCARNLNRKSTWINNQIIENYIKFSKMLESLSREININFTDLNFKLNQSKNLNKSLFVDRIHMNDLGYNEISKLILDNI